MAAMTKKDQYLRIWEEYRKAHDNEPGSTLGMIEWAKENGRYAVDQRAALRRGAEVPRDLLTAQRERDISKSCARTGQEQLRAVPRNGGVAGRSQRKSLARVQSEPWQRVPSMGELVKRSSSTATSERTSNDSSVKRWRRDTDYAAPPALPSRTVRARRRCQGRQRKAASAT